MTKSSQSSFKKELAALPLARIDTMDTSYTLPLREYLFTNGCQVFVNSGPTENVTYFFVVGDSNFVKKTLAFRHDIGKKQLIICWDTEEHESIEQFIGKHTKIVYVDPVPLTDTVLVDMFTFFFTAKGKELNAQKQTVKNFRQTSHEEPIDSEENDFELQSSIENEPLVPVSSNEYQRIEKNRIAKLISDMFGQKQEEMHKTVNKIDEIKHIVKTKNVRKNTTGLFVFALVSTISVLVFPFLLYIGSFTVRGIALIQSSNNFKEGKATLVQKNIKTERVWSGYTHLVAPLVHSVIKIGVGEKSIQTYERIDRLFDLVTDVEEELLTIDDAILSMGGALLLEQSNKPLTPVVAVDTIRKNMPSIRSKLDLAASYIQTFENERGFPFTLPFIQEKQKIIIDKITKFRQIAEVGERIAQIYPYFGGFRNKERVLVLLQNSSELRPTGGFIGSLAHLTISEGMLEDMKINDVYDLDGQLKGHIDPPTPIKELLNQEHWYLRDSNWNPNFPSTAEKVALFYEKETGEKVESIIGITSSFVVRILKIIGPVEIPYYKDRITADNFYLKSLYYTQANFFPGSTQKKDFLGALMEAILLKLQKDPQSGIAIMEIIHDSLASRDIQWYTTHEEGQRALTQFGWAGPVPAGNSSLLPTNKLSCFIHIYK
jgi:hypothetical protein